MRAVFLAVLIVAALAAPCTVHAQTSRWGVNLTLTQSFGSSSAAHDPLCVGSCSGRDVLAPLSLSSVEVELAHPIRDHAGWGFEYHARVVPFALARNNPTEAAVRGSNGWRLSRSTDRSSNVGIGVKPVGFRVWAGSTASRVEVDASTGFIRFFDPLLAANATHFNFALEVGVGVRVRGVVVGYRRHHVSNAGFGEVNPGLDSHVMYLGVPLR